MQRWVLDQSQEHAPKSDEELADYPLQVRELVQWAGAPESTPRGKAASPWPREGVVPFAVLAAILAAFVITATALRGGVSLLVAGLAIVQADGRRAARSQCGIRAFIVWLPITALLVGAAAVQYAAGLMHGSPCG